MSKEDEVRAIVVMGVSGVGKSTIGLALAKQLDFEFLDVYKRQERGTLGILVALDDQLDAAIGAQHQSLGQRAYARRHHLQVEIVRHRWKA